MTYLFVLGVIASFCFVCSVLMLVKDARNGFMFGSGGEDWFKLLWFIGSILIAIILMQCFQWHKLSLIPLTLSILVNAWWINKLIRILFLGRGFKKQ